MHIARITLLAGFDWDLVEKLKVGGVTRMIAEHSLPKTLAPPKVELILDQGHDTLLSGAQSQHLTRALEEVLGEAVDLVQFAPRLVVYPAGPFYFEGHFIARRRHLDALERALDHLRQGADMLARHHTLE